MLRRGAQRQGCSGGDGRRRGLNDDEEALSKPAVVNRQIRSAGRDAENVDRIRFDPPVTGKLIRLLVRGVPVAGVTIDESLVNATAFNSGRSRSLILEPDPGNPHAPNAIRVIGRWRGATGSENEEQTGVGAEKYRGKNCTAGQGVPHLRGVQDLVQALRREESWDSIWDLGEGGTVGI